MSVACCKFVALIHMLKIFLPPIQAECTKIVRVCDHIQVFVKYKFNKMFW